LEGIWQQKRLKEEKFTLKEKSSGFVPGVERKLKNQANLFIVKTAVNFSGITTTKILKAYKKHGKTSTISAKKTDNAHGAERNWAKDTIKKYVQYVWINNISIIPGKKGQ
jgi:transcription antitermination factor NusA-like protein